jgi:hypothetical protein
MNPTDHINCSPANLRERPLIEKPQYPFPSLDFPGRTSLRLSEMAEKLGVSVRHLQKEVEQGVLTVLDVKGKQATQSCWRVPVESYRDFIIARMTGPGRAGLLRSLPEATLRLLARELQDYLPKTTEGKIQPEAAETAQARLGVPRYHPGVVQGMQGGMQGPGARISDAPKAATGHDQAGAKRGGVQ